MGELNKMKVVLKSGTEQLTQSNRNPGKFLYPSPYSRYSAGAPEFCAGRSGRVAEFEVVV
jgi:hypothetical protein